MPYFSESSERFILFITLLHFWLSNRVHRAPVWHSLSLLRQSINFRAPNFGQCYFSSCCLHLGLTHSLECLRDLAHPSSTWKYFQTYRKILLLGCVFKITWLFKVEEITIRILTPKRIRISISELSSRFPSHVEIVR